MRLLALPDIMVTERSNPARFFAEKTIGSPRAFSFPLPGVVQWHTTAVGGMFEDGFVSVFFFPLFSSSGRRKERLAVQEDKKTTWLDTSPTCAYNSRDGLSVHVRQER